LSATLLVQAHQLLPKLAIEEAEHRAVRSKNHRDQQETHLLSAEEETFALAPPQFLA